MRQIVIIAHDLRSTHNVGSLLRTAEGLAVETVYLTGYTPYPLHQDGNRLPHIAQKLDKQIAKTALGAEHMVTWKHETDIIDVITALKQDGYTIVALEQTPTSIPLPHFAPPKKVAIILGREVEGIEQRLLAQCDASIEIPMYGRKESFNVVQAAAIALYHCRESKVDMLQ